MARLKLKTQTLFKCTVFVFCIIKLNNTSHFTFIIRLGLQKCVQVCYK
ncbi:hypothetical protein PAGA_b0751 [Pseudoalteromonas agarivorans DSM 14585]|uniref:Uncharacterized protein n=1 Tax=Pseudoalteromonas agarivorans DSM 14585 TaxID=1312369 RepID=A0ACA8E336_9GAMM|nr:hypothetical protein PAGA_b0751 [Pseudoalteromonas agarivorans DSM 14585]ETJ49502.1 hypothetical protein X564_03820 [Pseudoalteromonas agarivorans]